MMYQYVKHLDRTDLRNKALMAWEYSLKINPDQPDLTKLLKQYSTGNKVQNSPGRTVKTSVGGIQQLSRR